MANKDKEIYITTCYNGQLVANISKIVNMDIKSPDTHINLRERLLIFLDLETTGLKVQKHEIVEIGALKVSCQKPFDILGELEVKVKPKKIKDADKEALEINGYSKDGWKDALSLEEALSLLDEFSKGGVLVGYNTSFDWAFLDRAYFSLGRSDPFYYHRLDVMPMAFCKLFSDPSLKRFSLGELCNYFKIERKTAHRALDDAKVTYLVFKKLFEYTKGK